jgi:hypothetical protein
MALAVRSTPEITAPRSVVAGPPRATIYTAIALSLAALVWSLSSHSVVLYGDARATLDIARGLTDSSHLGVGQLGGRWLPLPELLMAPFAFSASLWHSGLAGAVVAAPCFCYAAIRLWGIIELVTSDRWAAWCGFLIFATNTNVLYIQTTALPEAVLLAFTVGAVFHLVRWMETRNLQDLVSSALLTAAATLTGYEAWVLLVAELVVILLLDRRNTLFPHETEANLVLYLSVAGSGILLWLLYNLVLYHNPLNFLRVSGSQNQLEIGSGTGPTHGILGAAHTYGWAILDVCGPIAVVCAVAGLVFVLRSDRLRRSWAPVVLVLLYTPVLFAIMAMLTGQSTVGVPEVAPFQIANIATAVTIVPATAVSAAFLLTVPYVRIRRRKLSFVLLVVLGLVATVITLGDPITLRGGQSGSSAAVRGDSNLVSTYLGSHYRNGEVLVDDRWSSALIFGSDLDLRDFVTSDSPQYQEDLRDPSRVAAWILTYRSDAIHTAMERHPGRFRNYVALAKGGGFSLYHLRIGAVLGGRIRQDDRTQ